MVQQSDTGHPLNKLCEEWLRKIDLAKKYKEEVFGKYAREASLFYDGPHDFMWKSEYASGKGGFLDKSASAGMPMFKMSVNKPFESVALFGPALMHKYPNVMVTPSDPPMLPPETLGLDVQFDQNALMAYQQYQMQDQTSRVVRESHASLFQHYANWLQLETNKKMHARRAITEAIIKGLGILFTELYSPRGSSIRYPRSVFVSCDDIVKDPDAEYNEDVQWVARRCCHPVNKVAEKYGLSVKELSGHLQSFSKQATLSGKNDAKSNKSKTGQTHDLIEYWEIYSKNGFGHRLKAANDQSFQGKYDMDWLGDYTYIVVAKNIPFPLNLPTSAMQSPEEEIYQRAQWPIPFWTDEGSGNGWPFSELYFFDKMNCVWPMSPVKPYIAELRFVNWCLSFLADKVAASSTTYVGILKAAGVEIQEQLSGNMAPYTILEIADIFGKSIKDVVTFLDAPQFSIDIWTMVSQVMELIDKRSGLTELIYGLTGTQIRSATEAGVRDQNLNIRPDDMAEKTEDFYSQSAMKEIEAAVWALEGNDVRGVLGDAGAMVFEQQIQTQEFENIVRDYSYRLQAGSARKPNKNNRLKTLNEWGQVALPLIQQFATSGIVEPWNAYVSEVAKAMDFDASRFLVQLPPPGEQGPSPEQQEMQQEIEAKRIELEMKLQEHQAGMEIDRERAKSDIEIAEEKAKVDIEIAKEKHQVELAFMRSKPRGTAQ